MLFSVIIIYYNSEKYVRESVESVLNQDFHDYELLLINDGSTDHTGEICEEYARMDSRIRIISKSINGGIADTRNTGINAAKGEYILFIDGDDYIAPGGLKSFEEKIEECEHKADYIWGRMSYFHDDDGKIYRTQTNLTKDIIKGLNGRDAFVAMYKESGHISMGVRGAFKREFILENNISFPDRFYEDINVIMQVILKADYLMINPYEYYLFRNRKDSTSKKYSLNHPRGIFEEMIWWQKNCRPYSDDLAFMECVKREINNRVKLAIIMYAKELSFQDMNALAELINQYRNESLNNFNLMLRLISTRPSLKAIHLCGKIIKLFK